MKKNSDIVRVGAEFVFRRLEDPEEGKRYSYVTGRYKSDYVGLPCICISNHDPYTMKFSDGAVWALSLCELGYPGNKPVKSYEQGYSRVRVKCRNIDTGVVYSSYCEAARAVGTSESNIRKACAAKGATAKGFRWETVK